MTTPHPDEDKYVLSKENIQVTRDLADAFAARDQDRIIELRTKLILPLRSLKGYGKEYVIRNGLPTITAEIANDTDWLK
jgi:ABC-type histidine transport system ATPase subunit